MDPIEPIGIVRTPFTSRSDAPRQGELGDATGEIVLSEPYIAGTRGLTAGDAIEVVWLADRADRDTLLIDDGRRGVFASRSQDRPNPVCVTRCELVAMRSNRLRVEGVDMLDETPVLDLKVPLRDRAQ